MADHMNREYLATVRACATKAREGALKPQYFALKSHVGRP
jgi:hypothetical protein